MHIKLCRKWRIITKVYLRCIDEKTRCNSQHPGIDILCNISIDHYTYDREWIAGVIKYFSLEGLIADTAPYCVPVYILELSGELTFDGYYMSELALEDHEEIECQN